MSAGMDNREWHILTCEFPPEIGGLADYSFQVAKGLAKLDHPCIVWAPGDATEIELLEGIPVHRCFGRFGLRALWRSNRLWVTSKNPKRILLQWNPSGYGLKSSNLPLCTWLACRVLAGDQLLIVFHEAFLGLSEGPLRRRAAAIVQRVMTILLLNSASRVFVATSSWAPILKPYCFSNKSITEQPIPANLTPCATPLATANTKRSIAPLGEPVIGHFGLYSPNVESLLIPSLLELLRRNIEVRVSLIGAGSIRYREKLISQSAGLSPRIYATGPCSNEEASTQISACDLMFQPYLEGITTRRTTSMAALLHGKCLVSTLGKNTEEVWRSSSAVHLIASREPYQMAEELEQVLLSPFEDTGHAGLRLYMEHFALSHTIEALVGIDAPGSAKR